MLAFDALVRGRVTESSQGVAVVVPRGRCKVETHEGIVSLSWGQPGVGATGCPECCPRVRPQAESVGHPTGVFHREGASVLERI